MATDDKQRTPQMRRFIAALPKDVAKAFNAAQLDAIEAALLHSNKPKKHHLDIRFVFALPFIKRRFYSVFLLGIDKRDFGSREAELFDQLYVLCGTLVILVFTAFGLASLYLVKSLLGIDLFDGMSLGIVEWLNSLD